MVSSAYEGIWGVLFLDLIGKAVAMAHMNSRLWQFSTDYTITQAKLSQPFDSMAADVTDSDI